MSNFRNEDYKEILNDCIHDIFYVDTSFRGKIAQIRLLSEIIIRKLIDYEPDKQLTIGNHGVLATVEALDSKNGPYYKQCIEAIKNDTDLYHAANSCSHSKVREKITKNDYEVIHDHFLSLLSCVFIQYFTKYRFGSNSTVMLIFSLLPPVLRIKVLTRLYENDKTNVDIIDRLVLAIMKEQGKDKAQDWVDNRKEHLTSISAIAPEMAAYLSKLRPDVTFEKNMYECCCEKIEKDMHGLYHTIEEAKTAYDSYKDKTDTTTITSTEIKEFIDLMDFSYTGRESAPYSEHFS